jgi:hypothetical protein
MSSIDGRCSIFTSPILGGEEPARGFSARIPKNNDRSEGLRRILGLLTG